MSTICVQKGSIVEGDKVVLIDDLIATGGTLCAGIELMKACKAEVVECACMIELQALNGREKCEKAGAKGVWGFISEDLLTSKVGAQQRQMSHATHGFRRCLEGGNGGRGIKSVVPASSMVPLGCALGHPFCRKVDVDPTTSQRAAQTVKGRVVSAWRAMLAEFPLMPSRHRAIRSQTWAAEGVVALVLVLVVVVVKRCAKYRGPHRINLRRDVEPHLRIRRDRQAHGRRYHLPSRIVDSYSRFGV